MRISDDHGMAILFDALMFLTVMAIVSVSFLNIMNSDPDEDEKFQSYVEAAHRSLLCSTFVSDGGPPHSISDVVQAYLVNEDQDLATKIIDQMRSILEGYFGPGNVYSWVAKYRGSHLQVDGDELSEHLHGEVHVSTVEWIESGEVAQFSLRVMNL